MKFIVPMIVGGVIGYATNWLAIKMLFKPHYEKRVWGVKIPFTPGLIPKEKKRIARNIGETVGEHLLSHQVIEAAILNENIENHMRLWIEGKIKSMEDSKLTIKGLTERLIDRPWNEGKLKVKKAVVNEITKLIESEKTVDLVVNLLGEGLFSHTTYKKINTEMSKVLDNILDSEELKKAIEGKLGDEFERISRDERKLIDIFPSNIKEEINNYLYKNIDEIGNYMSKIIDNPEIKYKLKGSISKIVSKNVSRLITSFISLESISEKIYVAIENYLKDPNTNKDIIFIIKSFLDEIMEKKLSDIGPEILNEVDTGGLSAYIISYGRKQENKSFILNLMGNKLKSLDKEVVMSDLSLGLNKLVGSDKFKEEIGAGLEGILVGLVNQPIIKVINRLNLSTEVIYNYLKNIFNKLLVTRLPDLITGFNISKIVEDEINKFDVEFAEQLILEIASKELKAITWLGALLGGIMGILSPLLQSI